MVQYQCTKPKLIYGGKAQSNETVSARNKYTVHNRQEASSLQSETPSACMQIPSFQLMLKAFLKVNFWNHQQLLHYTVFNCLRAIRCYIINLSFKFTEQQKVIRSHVWCQGRVSQPCPSRVLPACKCLHTHADIFGLCNLHGNKWPVA